METIKLADLLRKEELFRKAHIYVCPPTRSRLRRLNEVFLAGIS